jgi:hypothetical protein
MKKHLIITTDYYYPKPLANGICVANLVHEFVSKNYHVHIICYNNHNYQNMECLDNITIHRVKTRPFVNNYDVSINPHSISHRYYSYFHSLLTRLNILIFLPFYPLASFYSLFKYYTITKKVLKENGARTIVCVYNPIDSILTGSILKSLDKKIKFIVYSLDTLSNSVGVTYVPDIITRSIASLWESLVLKYSDLYFVMKSHELHYSKKRFCKYKNKIKSTDIPLVKYVGTSKNNLINNSTPILCLYSGALNKRTRNPLYLLRQALDMSINQHIDMRLDFYARGNCENLIKEYEIKSNYRISLKDYMNHREFIIVLMKADILISIGNHISDMVPSKVFEYISTGKPIIHFYSNPNDAVVKYINKYPIGLNIYEHDDYDNNSSRIMEFIMNARGKTVGKGLIDSLFQENTPKYTTDIMETYF